MTPRLHQRYQILGVLPNAPNSYDSALYLPFGELKAFLLIRNTNEQRQKTLQPRKFLTFHNMTESYGTQTREQNIYSTIITKLKIFKYL